MRIADKRGPVDPDTRQVGNLMAPPSGDMMRKRPWALAVDFPMHGEVVTRYYAFLKPGVAELFAGLVERVWRLPAQRMQAHRGVWVEVDAFTP